jgi:hypothetical protein
MGDEFDFLWEIIDNHHKFEIIAYLAVSCEDPVSEWFLTPKTRDEQRDAEGHSASGVNFFEAKFFEKDNHKLNLTRIGTNILIAVCNQANKIYIFSNGNLAPSIIKFLEKHQCIESSENRQTKILFYDRQQTSISILKHVDGDMSIKNDEIKFVNYRSLTESQIEKYRVANKIIAEEAISLIKEKKEENKDNFFLNPTVSNFNNIDCSKKKKIAEDNYFSFSLCFDENEADFESIRITVGHPFFMYISVSNCFSEKLICRISIRTTNVKNSLKILNNWDTLKDCYVKEIEVDSLKSEIILINSLFQNSDYDGIDVSVDVYSQGQLLFRKEKHIKEEIHLSNKFFFTHYFGGSNNLAKSNLDNLFTRSFENSKYRVRIIKGPAGVGKSRLITETLNETYHLNPKRDVLNCTMGQDNLISICKKILQLTIGIDYNSLQTIQEQLKLKYNLNRTGNLKYIFKDEIEFYYLCNEIDTLLCNLLDRPDEKTIEKTAELFGKLLLRFHRGTSVLIFEDIHRCTDVEFQFFLEFDNYLRRYNGENLTIMIFATRTLGDININDVGSSLKGIEQNVTQSFYSYFELKLAERHSKEIISILTDLEPGASNAMIRDVLYGSAIDEPYIQKIISLCGNNPFGIIHTLIQLNSLKIISDNRGRKYYLETINKLESAYKPHEQIDYIFDVRFNTYKKSSHWEAILEIIHALVIFKSQIEFTALKELIQNGNSFSSAFDILEEERIIVYSSGIVRFEHENLFIYASNKQMDGSQNIADKIFLFLENKQIKSDEEYIVRALYWGSPQYKNEFYKYAKSYFYFLYEKDLWRESIYYGNLILNKKEMPPNQIDIREIEMKVRMLQSECDDTLEALNMMRRLFIQVKQELLAPQMQENYERYYDLYLEMWLQKSDLELHAGQAKEAQDNLNGLICEIRGNTDNIGIQRQYELYAWIYNRLGVVKMKNKDYTNCINYLQKGLKYAQEINHLYYTHHNYYDLCIVNLLKGDTEYMNHYCQMAQMDFLKEDRYKNARARTMLQVCLVSFVQERRLETVYEVKKNVENALFHSYFHEANRGLLYLSSMYLLLNLTDDCDEILTKGVKYAEIDRSVKILLGLYSGCIYRFHSQYVSGRKEALEIALEYFKKVLSLIVTPQHIKISVNYWIGMVIHNLQTFDIFLQQEAILPNFNNEEIAMIRHLRNYQIVMPENVSRFKVEAITEGNLAPYYAIFS